MVERHTAIGMPGCAGRIFHPPSKLQLSRPRRSGEAMSMRRSVDQIRTTHTGSLPRPPDMLETLHQLAAGHSIDPAAYESALTRHVADIVKRQVKAGIDTVSDGECSKPSFQHYVAERLAGFEARVPEGGLPVPTGPIGLDGRDALMFPDFYRNVLDNNPFRRTIRMPPRVCVGP